MTTVALEHVSKTFATHESSGGHKITAVEDVSLKLNTGDVLAILGPSGCGKSTLLRLISGIHKPDKGRILYDDVDLEDVPLRERGIGMVFQEGALIPHWESRRSVGFFLSLRNREPEVPEKLHQISKITGIGINQLLDRRPSHLSGGEKQRVGIARALARDLQVLLFDEPFANLDAKYRTEARVELKRLLNAFPVTSVYVTHDQVEAIALSHRIAVMRAGKIDQVGTYQQLYTSPHNIFVATFIGSPPINLFKGRSINGLWQGENFGGYHLRRDLPEDSKVTAAIRAEHMHLQDGGIPGVVEQVVPMLAERHQLITTHLGGETWTITVPLDQHIERGSTIYCGLQENEMLFFDTATGVRIG
ncbi:MAG: ABC transporter ATP-binding protein [Chloroflexi bacterium]|nr:ABC transporter ATP-binding protein [Chloroflexota bacterium]MCC6895418.1 ABC transporter ATP-binding protein [Anaerolineae bacterium]